MDEPDLPTDAEFKLLRELWEHGEQTVGDLHARVQAYWPVGYTTVLKLLQRMTGKGLVERERDGRAHLYRPAVAKDHTERRVLSSFLERVFDGSLHRLVQRALPLKPATPAEWEEIQRHLERLED